VIRAERKSKPAPAPTIKPARKRHGVRGTRLVAISTRSVMCGPGRRLHAAQDHGRFKRAGIQARKDWRIPSSITRPKRSNSRKNRKGHYGKRAGNVAGIPAHLNAFAAAIYGHLASAVLVFTFSLIPLSGQAYWRIVREYCRHCGSLKRCRHPARRLAEHGARQSRGIHQCTERWRPCLSRLPLRREP
jgi:hypothetical protein